MGFPAENPRQILYHDAARHVATVFEKCNCLIETYLHDDSHKSGAFPLLELRGFKSIAYSFPKDVATRRAASLQKKTLRWWLPQTSHNQRIATKAPIAMRRQC